MHWSRKSNQIKSEGVEVNRASLGGGSELAVVGGDTSDGLDLHVGVKGQLAVVPPPGLDSPVSRYPGNG